MTKKLSLNDLKVQSFVTVLTDREAQKLVGGTGDPDCNPDTVMPSTAPCGTQTWHSQCCTDSQYYTDTFCGCSAYTTVCYSCGT